MKTPEIPDHAGLSASNMPQLTVGDLVSHLASAYCAVIENGLSVSTVPAAMLWGPPGVGKSQAVRQIAQRIEESTGKRTHVTDVRLLLFNPIDLRGIPTANADKTLAVWLKPQIFQMDESADCVNILFLDEITAAPQSVQAAAYQITLDRVVGEHRLPDNCIVMAAGNRVTDRSVAYKMPKPLANRLMHFEVWGSFSSWRSWAVENGVNEKVLGFLSFNPIHLMGFNVSSDDLAFPTPRSWEMVSNLLNGMQCTVKDAYQLIAGTVGAGVAVEFVVWEQLYDDLPSVEDIFDGKNPPVPTQTDVLYALVSSMTAYAREHVDDMDRIAHSIRYAQQLPPDFSAVLLKDYQCLKPGFREQLLAIPEFSRWLLGTGTLFNGVG